EGEGELAGGRVARGRGLAQFAGNGHRSPARSRDEPGGAVADAGIEHEAGELSAMYAVRRRPPGGGGVRGDGPRHSSRERTEAFLNHGRGSAYHRGLSRGRAVGMGAVLTALLVTVVGRRLSRG